MHGNGGGYYDQYERPLTKDEVFVDNKGNLVDRRRNPVQDFRLKPLNILDLWK